MKNNMLIPQSARQPKPIEIIGCFVTSNIIASVAFPSILPDGLFDIVNFIFARKINNDIK